VSIAALRGHTILARMMRDGPSDGASFDAGRPIGRPGGLLHQSSAYARWLWPIGWRSPGAGYLSGILVGMSPRRPAQADGAVVQVIARRNSPTVCQDHRGLRVTAEPTTARRGTACTDRGARTMELTESELGKFLALSAVAILPRIRRRSRTSPPRR